MVSWSFCLGTVLFTVLASANDCTDNPDFEDKDGNSCEDWKGYECEDALSWGLTEEGMQDLIDSCCKSCNPPPIPPYPMDCKNDAEFEDVKGYVCEDWVGYNCKDFWNGYSDEDMQDVRDYCCETCSTNCADNWQFTDQKGYRCGAWKGYDCRKAVEDWDYTQDAEDKLLEECCATCSAAIRADAPPVSYPEDCRNDAEFKDVKGYECEDWVGYDCGDFWIGYSDVDMQDVRDNCCETCSTHCADNWLFRDQEGYRCGAWKGYDCRKAVEDWDYTQDAEDKLNQECCATCSDDCADGYFFTDAKGYSCKDWDGYDCNTAVEEWEYTESEAADILDNCCKTCAAFEGEGESEESESSDDEMADGPLNFSGYVGLCEKTTDGETCKNIGCKYKKKAKAGKNCAGPKTQNKVKCKKIKDEGVCGRIGCDFKKEKCKGKPENF